MSRYEGDPRVTALGNGFGVDRGDELSYAVLETEIFGWGCYWGPGLTMVQMPGGPGGMAIGFGSSDDAIGALLGEPPPGHEGS